MANHSDILYNFAENHDGLDHIQRVQSDIHAINDDITKIFRGISDLWQGSTPEALVQTHVQIERKLVGFLEEITATATGAGDQQDEMAALDRNLAGGF